MLAPLKLACQVLSGKRHPDVQEACQALSGKEPIDDCELTLPFIPAGSSEPIGGLETGCSVGSSGGAFVRHLGTDPSASRAEVVSDFLGGGAELEALALEPPAMLEVTVPMEGAGPGDLVRAQGPHGPVTIRLPENATPGATLQYRLAPKPEYRVEVPKGAGPGWIVRFETTEGDEVRVPVPRNKWEGDIFEVAPPALMVKTPAKAVHGDWVLFSRQVPPGADGRGGRTEFFRCRVPPSAEPGFYFTALLPKVTAARDILG